jgi:hypothetical protein
MQFFTGWSPGKFLFSASASSCSSESFNGKFRDELVNREIFYTLEEAKIIIEQWRKGYNTHSALHYRPTVPEAVLMPELAYPLTSAAVPTTT